MYDRYKEEPQTGIDCIMLTLNAELHLQETLDSWYKEVPIRRLLVIDGDSKDKTHEILTKYPRITIWIKPGMTTGKAFELLKNQVQTPWFIFIDVGKIPSIGWFKTMLLCANGYDMLGSIRFINKNGILSLDPTIKNPTKRPLGGPWLIRTSRIRSYHVDDDYVQRNTDIVIRKQLEENGGKYHLVTDTSHICHPSIPINDKEELKQRHIQNAKGIVKYITPDYAKTNASYLLDDHWMLMMNNLSIEWIQNTNSLWIPILKSWKKKRLLIAKLERFVYHSLLRK